MSQYNIIAESPEYNVVSEYERAVQSSDAYQSEADLEKEFIRLLGEQWPTPQTFKGAIKRSGQHSAVR